jgi:hypothetical protein
MEDKVMIWKLDKLREKDVPQVYINGKWVIARPVNYKYRSIKVKFIEAWNVFIGKAEAFRWPEGQ